MSHEPYDMHAAFAAEAERMLVHADGGPCHGKPIVGWRCTGCGEAPDMQSTELRPVGGWLESWVADGRMVHMVTVDDMVIDRYVVVTNHDSGDEDGR